MTSLNQSHAFELPKIVWNSNRRRIAVVNDTVNIRSESIRHVVTLSHRTLHASHSQMTL